MVKITIEQDGEVFTETCDTITCATMKRDDDSPTGISVMPLFAGEASYEELLRSLNVLHVNAYKLLMKLIDEQEND